MPALTTVTFRDDDGDEFPVALVGFPPSEDDSEGRAEVERLARLRGEALEREGAWRPNGDLTLVSIEG